MFILYINTTKVPHRTNDEETEGKDIYSNPAGIRHNAIIVPLRTNNDETEGKDIYSNPAGIGHNATIVPHRMNDETKTATIYKITFVHFT